MPLKIYPPAPDLSKFWSEPVGAKLKPRYRFKSYHKSLDLYFFSLGMDADSKVVWEYLNARYGKNPRGAFPTVATIGTDCGFGVSGRNSPRTERALCRLEELGWVLVKRSSRHAPNEYDPRPLKNFLLDGKPQKKELEELDLEDGDEIKEDFRLTYPVDLAAESTNELLRLQAEAIGQILCDGHPDAGARWTFIVAVKNELSRRKVAK